jgi:pimeloyl-ACP methyl ester carboxylesterase
MAAVANMFAAFAQIIVKVGMEQAVEVVANQSPFAQIREQDPEYFDLQLKWMKRQNGPAIAVAMRGLVNGPPLPLERFPEIEAPAFVIAHPDDPIHPLSSVELLESTLRKCEVFLAPSSAFYRQHPEAVAKTMRNFLSVRQAA